MKKTMMNRLLQPGVKQRQRGLRLASGLLVFCLVLAQALTAVPALAVEAFSLTVTDQVRPYRQDALQLHIPHDGRLSLRVLVQGQDMVIVREMAVQQGPVSLDFSGLTCNGEPLPRGEAVMVASLASAQGVLEAQAAFRVLQPAAGILYALLSRDSLSIHDPEDLYTDLQLSRAGSLQVALYQAEDLETPLFRRSYDYKDSLPHAYRWDRTINRQPAAPGDYVFSFSMKGSAQEPLLRPFTLTDDPYEAPPLSPTPAGLFLPEELTEEAIWAAMMAPVTVLDIGAMQHQRVYSAPSETSPSLGMVHGQTAGLDILEIRNDGFAKVRAARHGDGHWITGYVPDKKLKTIQPHQRYGVLIDKNAQTITVYEQGRKLGSLNISTGIYVPPGVKSFDTVPGAFLTQARIAEFTSEGIRYEYAMRIDGGNLLHGAGYQVRQGQRDYSLQETTLGQVASHGCVRIDNRISDDDLNAWWLYANLPRNTKVLVLPDVEDLMETDNSQAENLAEAEETASPEEAPLETEPADLDESEAKDAGPATSAPAFQVLAGDAPVTDLPETPAAPEASPAPSASTTITMTFGGDCVLGSEEHSRSKPESFHAIIEQHGMDWPFSGLSKILHQDDISMVNLENVLKDNSRGLNPRLHNFRGPAIFAQILKLGGIDLVNIANNHFVDYGQEGKNSTRDALRDHDIPFSGYSALYVYEKNGIKIGFGGIRETVFHQNRKRIADEIAELKRRGCDYIVYTCHFGIEYEEQHNEVQTLMARSAIDAGANLVIGHHTHVVQGIEEYKGGLIFYSLGNLVFGGNLELSTFDGLMAQVRLHYDGNTLKETAVRLIPVITSGIRPENDFRPVVAEGEDKARILNTINQDSEQTYPEQFVLR